MANPLSESTCPYCDAQAVLVDTVSIDVGHALEAERYDCAQGHTALVVFTEEMRDEDYAQEGEEAAS